MRRKDQDWKGRRPDGFVRRFRRRRPGWASCRLGATAVEFALVAPVFLAMMLGMFEMGRAMWIKSTMQYAVEETARYFVVNNSASTSTLETYARSTLTGTGMSDPGSTILSFTAAEETTGSVTFMSITATYTFTVLVPIIPLPDMTLSAKSRVPKNS